MALDMKKRMGANKTVLLSGMLAFLSILPLLYCMLAPRASDNTHSLCMDAK